MDLRAILNSPDTVLKTTTRSVNVPSRPKIEQFPLPKDRWRSSLWDNERLVMNDSLRRATPIAHDSSARPTPQNTLPSQVVFPSLNLYQSPSLSVETSGQRPIVSSSYQYPTDSSSDQRSNSSLSNQSPIGSMPRPIIPSSSPEPELDAGPDAGPSNERPSDDSAPQRCNFMDKCILESEDRKVISHFFGRNKMCTRLLPDEVFETYCRKHYQRARYRSPENFSMKQIELVRFTVENIRDWGGVSEFEFTLRKRAREHVEAWSAHREACGIAEKYRKPLPSLPLKYQAEPKELWLIPHIGKHKTADNMFEILNELQKHVHRERSNPEFEILTTIKNEFITTSKPSKRTQAKPRGARPKGQQRTPVKSNASKRRVTSAQAPSTRRAKKAARRKSSQSAYTPASQLRAESQAQRRISV